MSACHRKISRLPVEVFANLNDQLEPSVLRSHICSKLKRFPVKSRNGGSKSVSVKTVGDLLRTSKRTLLHALDPLLTYEGIELFLKQTCRQCAAKPVSTLSLLHRTTDDLKSLQPNSDNNNNTLGEKIRYLPTGIPSLDKFGGVRVGTVTELVGRAGAGKTQLALQLILMASKYNQGAMYIDTEKKIILARLREMTQERLEEGATSANRTVSAGSSSYDTNYPNRTVTQEQAAQFNSFKSNVQVMQNMTIKQPNSTEDLLKVLDEAEEEILYRNQQAAFPVRLLVVDSIAAPMRRDFGSDAAPQRAAAVFYIAQTLKRLADQLHLAVVVVNQVGIDNSAQNQNYASSRRFDQVAVRAALGTSWHHCVSTRLLLEHEVDPHREGWRPDGGQASQVRSLSVVKSNAIGFTKMYFEVIALGIVEVTPPENADSEH